MRRFSFTLDRVLNYKTQIERSLRNEHAQIMQKVIRKEGQIGALEQKHQTCAVEYDQVKQQGAMVNRLRAFEDYLQSLSDEINAEKQNLAQLKVLEEKKRLEVITAKQDTASIDMLKTKRRQEYDREVLKDDERLIEEFVSNTMSGSAIAG
ncbi:flagellar export protein FliJ [Muricomes intestini]|uniref:Flagellar FliJ protein n=1 Tax=Muricomes intestini TaxID=1796634 RepID=A0A4R3KI67_9FIRM|nr:flagellar FliJ family protein [Muricomes intestini]TCS82775.1 flagellar export protein FliJ [Muricomes intestini]HAX51261.1 flagellar export protein FliJ [Lachnospiraceae bacterium]